MKARQVKCGVFAAAILGWTAAFGAVGVSDVKVQQRWPWNGLVDIDFTVTSDNANDDVYVYPTAHENDRNIDIAPRTLTGDGVNGASVKPGKHRMTWNMSVDEPELHSSAFSVTMHAFRGAPYLVVDLSGGTEATTFPVRYSATGPDISDNACRTTNMWFRICLPGTFMMGSPTDEPGRRSNETLHSVILSKPFFIAVFETTQRQYELVMGVNPSCYKGLDRPVESVSYDMIRGNVTGCKYPAHNQVDPSSFMGVMRAKTGILFDLPTEAQWEYACRAGTSTAFNSGKDYSRNNLNEVGRNQDNCKDGKGGYSEHTCVGSYRPNQWGLYDMHGNVSEWCLDWWQDNLGSSATTNPVGGDSGSYRVCRGGQWSSPPYTDYAVRCRSASRFCGQNNDWTYPNDDDRGRGFRVACIPVVE